jgi:hypothetical protein
MPWITLVAAEGKLAIGPPNLAKFPCSRVFALRATSRREELDSAPRGARFLRRKRCPVGHSISSRQNQNIQTNGFVKHDYDRNFISKMCQEKWTSGSLDSPKWGS